MRISDWSSDVCSSDLLGLSCVGDHLVDQAVFQGLQRGEPAVAVRVALDLLDRAAGVLGDELAQLLLEQQALDRQSVVSGKSVSVRVEHGGRRIIKTKKHEVKKECNNT